MKKLLLIAVTALICSSGAYAQSNVKYCELLVYQRYFRYYVAEMHVDGNIRPKHSIIRDVTGKPMKFASDADALNYLAGKGWELVTAYNRTKGGATHFILKKTV